MNIVAGDLFTHLSVIISNPDTPDTLRTHYISLLSRLEDRSTSHSAVYYEQLGEQVASIFSIEQIPDEDLQAVTGDSSAGR
jgi:hypothetical protein